MQSKSTLLAEAAIKSRPSSRPETGRAHVDKWKQSGLSMNEYCRRQGLAVVPEAASHNALPIPRLGLMLYSMQLTKWATSFGSRLRKKVLSFLSSKSLSTCQWLGLGFKLRYVMNRSIRGECALYNQSGPAMRQNKSLILNYLFYHRTSA